MQQEDLSIQTVVEHYKNFNEQDRLSDAWGQIEFVRSIEILKRYLPEPPAVVLDVGGAAGKYACWLARQGYEVSLIDPVTLHIQQAEEASAKQPETPIRHCILGDARKLDFEDSSADAVLLMGPLYHLTERSDRIQALREAHRVLRNGGVLFAVGISRFASTIDGLDSGFFDDPAFRKIMEGDLKNGQHRNPTDDPRYFTDTFFHHPDELGQEVQEANFALNALLAVEGISYVMQDFGANWNNEGNREFLLKILRTIEREPSLIGASPHIMCVGRKS